MGRLSGRAWVPQQAQARLGWGLALALAACAPLAGQAPLLPYPGGFAQGGVVSGRFAVALPGTPLFLDADEKALYAAYPYQLLVYEEGGLKSLPLPGVPRFLRASPRPVVGLEGAIWTEEGLYPYSALDALLMEEGLYHVDGRGLYREGRRLKAGGFRQVVAWEGRVVALGEEVLFYPEGPRYPLPHPARKAQAGACGVVALLDKVYLVGLEGARPLAEAQDFAAFGEEVYLVPERAVRCKEAVWP
ncbi:hypothetical protein SAMN04488243_12115 [Thermus arciformis]|uniref:Lipoprotein n=1 Tax=Thermus arciformis TaxID=482827 RepID=A0A1G7HRE6_9DEIN|nr:hypothetical protein [Thermus arciformis]SDF02913.1 hypothetical protein SAMN04488243_12115 [Thermus arciformis]